MKNQTLTNWAIYRWRYVLGYGVLIILFVLAVTVASVYAPGGLSQHEIDMVAITNQIQIDDLSTLAITNLPFHLLQYASFALFGVSILTIKLPAILLSIATATSLFFLLRRWFRPNVSILAMLIMVATGQLIFLSQSFTPGILYVLYSGLILLFSSLIVQKAKYQQVWKITLGAVIGLSMFTPYFWYINLGLLLVALIHPHPRHFLLQKKYRLSWIPAALTFLVLFGIAFYFGFINPAFGKEIFGLESLDFNLSVNSEILLHSYVWLTPVVQNGQIAPIMDFASLALIILGFILTIRQRSTARSYMIWIWLLLALPLLLVKPELITIITVPLFILLAIGVETLLHEWYGLFPKNPYARGVGLVLTIGLISVMTLSGVDRYMHGYKHTPESITTFNTDLPILQESYINHNISTIYANSNEAPIFQAFANHNTDPGKELSVQTGATIISPSDTNFIITRSNKERLKKQPNAEDWVLETIVTNDRSINSDRFYIYKPHKK